MTTHVFTVADMSCGHCIAHITAALEALDPRARVDIALEDKRVRVDSDRSQAEIAQALNEAGYGAVVREGASG